MSNYIEISFEIGNEVMVVEKSNAGIMILIYDKDDHKRKNQKNAFGIYKDSFANFQNFFELNKSFENISFCEKNGTKLSFKTEYLTSNDYPDLIVSIGNKEYKIEKIPNNDILEALRVMCV